MKPKTKLQKRVAEYFPTLPILSESQKTWIHKKVFDHFGFKNKSGTTCLECGYTFQSSKKKEICPNCGLKIEIVTTKKRVVADSKCVCFITTHKEFQVLRFFDCSIYCRRGNVAAYHESEVANVWIDEKGKTTYVSKLQIMGWNPSWLWGSSLEVRKNFRIGQYVISPKVKVLPIIKRNGFDGKINGFNPIILFVELLTNTYFETLWKAGYYNLLLEISFEKEYMQRYWPALKLAMRKKYQPIDVKIWLDHLKLLVEDKKDLSNPMYSLPANLVKEHNDYIARRRERMRKKRHKELKAEMDGDNIEYQKRIEKFKDLHFKNGDLIIEPIKRVHDFYELGDKLNNCIFENAYYRKENLLMFVAYIDYTPIEIISVRIDVRNIYIAEARGYDNEDSPFNKEIVSLLNSHMKDIKKAIKPKKEVEYA